MALLPDKKRRSYHVFVLLLLLEIKKRFGTEKLSLQKLKMDFELGQIFKMMLVFLSLLSKFS